MADFVEIITDKAIGNIKSADSALNSLLKTLNLTVETSNKLNISGGNKPSQLNSNTSANNAQIERNIKNLERQRLAEIKLQQDREKAFAKYEQNLQKETARLEVTNSVYTKVQQKLNSLNKEYRDLAVQKELTGKLTDSESRRYDFLSNKISKYDKILKGVDASMGKYQRNVGNYASGFNPLNNALNQLTREAPAFAVSLNTGFLAISNNLPAFFDAMQNIVAQNKELLAQGKPIQSFWKQFASGLFSLQTALSVGITLLTLFGGQIADALFNTDAKTKADEAAKAAIDEKNKSEEQYNETLRRTSSEEISRSKLLFENARNGNITYERRLQYISELRQRYPDYLKNLTDEQILAGQTAEAEARLNDALLKRGIALALQEKIGKAFGRLTDEIVKQQKAQQDILKVEENVRKADQQALKGAQGQASAINQINSTQQKRIELGKVLTKAQELSSVANQTAIKKEIAELLNLYNTYSPYLDAVREGTGVTKKAAEATEQFAEANSKVAFERNISELRNRLDLMSKENAMYPILAFNIQLLEEAYNQLYGSQEEVNEATEKLIKFGTAEYYQDRINKLQQERDSLASTTEEYAGYNRAIETVQADMDRLTGKTDDVKKLNDEIQKFLNGFTSSALSQSGFSSLTQFLQVDENGKSPFASLLEDADNFGEEFAVVFNSIGEVAQDAYKFLNQTSQAYFNQQYANLEREKDLALKFSGESEAGRAEIERQYEERRRQIRRRELQQEKEGAIFNAVIDTAQGVVAALATGPAGIPLAAVIAALGAAQIALIASQPIPAYKHGTDNHKGGLALVGDGGKHEVVYQPSLGWSITPNKDTLVNLEKGSKVFPDLASSGIFNSSLPDMIQLNGGGLTAREMDNIMRKNNRNKPVAPVVNIYNKDISNILSAVRSKPGKA